MKQKMLWPPGAGLTNRDTPTNRWEFARMKRGRARWRAPASGPFYAATVHAAPLTVNAVGRGLVPVCVALKPTESDPPAGTEPFQDSFTPVTAVPLCVHRAPQPCVMRCPPEKVNATVHDDHALGPVLRIVRLPVKPVDQSLVLYETAHGPDGPGVVGAGVVGAGVV